MIETDPNPDVTSSQSNGSVDTSFFTSGVESGASISSSLAMITAPSRETVMVGTPTYGSGIILQEFHTLSNAQRLYVEQDADYNVTSITDINGNVVERYEYDPYGNVTVLNTNGTTRGDGLLHSSFYAWNYTFQGGRDDVETGQIEFERRDDNIGLGRWDQEDPDIYVNGPNRYQLELSSPPNGVDPVGEDWIGLMAYAFQLAIDAAVAQSKLPAAPTAPPARPAPPTTQPAQPTPPILPRSIVFLPPPPKKTPTFIKVFINMDKVPETALMVDASICGQLGATVATIFIGPIQIGDHMSGNHLFGGTELQHHTLWGIFQGMSNEGYKAIWSSD